MNQLIGAPRRFLPSSQLPRPDATKRSEKAARVQVDRKARLCATNLYLRRAPPGSAQRRSQLATHKARARGAETLPPKAKLQRSVSGSSECDPVLRE